MSSQASDETPTGSSNASQISKLSASPSPSEVASPTVLVVGGGVCGLVTGLALSSAGCEVHIYEQHDVQSSSASGDISFLVTDELQQFLKSCEVPLVSAFGSWSCVIHSCDNPYAPMQQSLHELRKRIA